VEALENNLVRAREAAEAGDRVSFYAFDVGFHQTTATYLGLQRSNEVLDGVRAHLERVRRMMTLSAARNRETLVEHEKVVAAISIGDVDAARDAMNRHLTQTTEQFESFARQRPELFSA
jgi:DNA-binding GntR family transcriptional regulator